MQRSRGGMKYNSGSINSNISACHQIDRPLTDHHQSRVQNMGAQWLSSSVRFLTVLICTTCHSQSVFPHFPVFHYYPVK